MKNECNNMSHKSQYLSKVKKHFSDVLFELFKILPCTLISKVRCLVLFNEQALTSWVGLWTCITLLYLYSKGKIIGGGEGKHPPSPY